MDPNAPLRVVGKQVLGVSEKTQVKAVESCDYVNEGNMAAHHIVCGHILECESLTQQQ